MARYRIVYHIMVYSPLRPASAARLQVLGSLAAVFAKCVGEYKSSWATFDIFAPLCGLATTARSHAEVGNLAYAPAIHCTAAPSETGEVVSETLCQSGRL